MICLPPLLVDERELLLPAHESSALVLAELLLTEPDPADMRERLSVAMAADPGLALWTFWRFRQEPAAERREQSVTCASLAAWLIDRVEAVLDWPEDSLPPAALDRLGDDLDWLLDTHTDRLDPPPSLLEEIGSDLAGWADRLRRQIANGDSPSTSLSRVLPLLGRRIRRLRALQSRFDATLEHEKVESLAEFAAGAGHEINNPLTVISGRAQLLLRGETDPERRHDLALISAQAMRVNEMIADMRLFARPPVPNPEAFDVAALLDRLAEELSADSARLEIAFQRDGRREPTPITADAAQIEVVLRAICRNAVEAIGHGGVVRLGLAVDDRVLRITVADNGPGITDEQRRHIFDPFYSARQAGRGLGLGLSKAWRIVTAHAGRIDVESEPGHGTVFRITLPISPSCPSAS